MIIEGLIFLALVRIACAQYKIIRLSPFFFTNFAFYEDIFVSGTQGSVVGIATKLLAERSGIRIQVGTIAFCLLQNVHTNSGVHSASYSMGSGVLSQG